MAASYFDVDGTLVRTSLIQPTVFYLLNQQTPLQSAGRFLRAALKAPQMALAETRDRRLFNELLYSAYEGISRDRLLLLADECFDQVVKPALFPNARSLVQRCRDEGHEVVLVSGALDFVMQHLCEYLGAGDSHRQPAGVQAQLRHRAPAAAGGGRAGEGAPHPRARARARP